jgi:hypothetical protein
MREENLKFNKLHYLGSKEKDRHHNGQKRRTDNTMAKRGQTTQWSKEKDRQHNGQKKTYKRTQISKTLYRKLKIEQHLFQ